MLDVGPGIGYFTIPMARRVGSGGRVIAADIQESMLRGIVRRAERAGVRGQIELYLSRPDEIYSGEPVDFILSFWMAHEVPRLGRFSVSCAPLSNLRPASSWRSPNCTCHGRSLTGKLPRRKRRDWRYWNVLQFL